MKRNAQHHLGLLSAALILAGCASAPLPRDTTSTSNAAELARRAQALQEQEQLLARQQRELDTRAAQLSERSAQISAREAELSAAGTAQPPTATAARLASVAPDDGLLPPDAKAGECYARVYSPPKYRVITEKRLKTAQSEKIDIIPARYTEATETVLVRPESVRYEAIEATYKTVTEEVLVKPATTRLVEVPARFEKQTERVLVKAGYTTWKKGTGPIQKIDEATGEIMCLVEVPPVYKDVTKTVLVSPATTREEEVPAVFRTVRKQVIDQPARTREIIVPAQYRQVPVRKLAEPAREVKTPIPAVYQDVERRELIAPGQLEWRSILCETNITRERVMAIQQALADAGFDPGPIDGSVQRLTMRAVNAYQRANGLPVDKYLNIETVKALGISPR